MGKFIKLNNMEKSTISNGGFANGGFGTNGGFANGGFGTNGNGGSNTSNNNNGGFGTNGGGSNSNSWLERGRSNGVFGTNGGTNGEFCTNKTNVNKTKANGGFVAPPPVNARSLGFVVPPPVNRPVRPPVNGGFAIPPPVNMCVIEEIIIPAHRASKVKEALFVQNNKKKFDVAKQKFLAKVTEEHKKFVEATNLSMRWKNVGALDDYVHGEQNENMSLHCFKYDV